MSALLKKLGAVAVAGGLMLGCDGDEGSSNPGKTDGDLPSQVTCEGDVCRVQAPPTDPITKSFTMTADKKWLLQGGVFVGDDVNETVLTLEPGTTVFGETSSKAFLTIRRGSKIVADGTKDAPIVLTSSKEVGSRQRGDWGGLVINGRAPVNGCDTAPCESEGEGGTGVYGGDQPGDDSGVLRYVRVEFAGHPITEDNELNGIAFQGVGNGTTIEYVQVHMADDDGIEFFGGTANFKYVLTTGIADDNLDWTDGWVGKGQFFVAQQYADAGDNGIEADNNGDRNDALPRAMPMLSNLTFIGSPDASSSDMGILLREGTGAHIHNSVIVGWNDACFDIDNAATFAVAMSGGTPTGDLVIENSIFSCATNFKENNEKDVDGQTVEDPWSVAEFVTTHMTGNRTVDPLLRAPYAQETRDFRPADGSPAATGGVVPSDPFFTQVDFVGGVDPANDWTAGWTTSALK